MKYHFENKQGWMNDPNGLVFYKGKYHAFFQHYPYAPRWGQMHWGHAVSDDLITWEELDIALFPDREYEDEGGCFSGSAIVKDDRLWLFYTSVSKAMGQTQSIAYSDDGLTFTKYEGNPIIKESPLSDRNNFRDPKVFKFGEEYRMVVGAGINNEASIALFKSKDLINWDFVGAILKDIKYGSCIECPNLFEVDGRWVLMFSSMKELPHKVCFSIGDFDGMNFVPNGSGEDSSIEHYPIETGPDFYAPQAFIGKNGEVIVIAWMYNWTRLQGIGRTHVGAFTIPREMRINKAGKLTMMPISEAMRYVVTESPYVSYDNGLFRIQNDGKTVYSKAMKEAPEMLVLHDSEAVEVFINGGEETITAYI